MKNLDRFAKGREERRTLFLAAALGLPAVLIARRSQAQSARALTRTPSQTEGPFYPVADLPDSDADLLRNGSLSYQRGTPCWLQGQVLDLDGVAVGGATVEIWQCDDAGNYHHPRNRGQAAREFQGFGRVAADAQGRYRFRTIRPSPYVGRTPHIHLKVKLGSRELLTTQLYVEGDPGNAGDVLWRALDLEQRKALTRPFVQGPDGLRVDFPLVVAT